MDIDLGPLSELTPLGVLSVTALITFIDVVAAYVLAAVQRKFDLGFVGEWLLTHSLLRVTPIYLLLAAGVGIPALDIPAVPALFTMAVVGVGAYFGETIKSVIVNFADARAVRDQVPTPPPGPVPTP